MKEEVEAAIRSLPVDKAPGADNIPAELLKYGGKELVALITSLCQKVWETKTWPDEWTRSLVIPLPKKGNPRKCQKLQENKFNQPLKQGNAKDHSEQTEK